MKVCIAHQLLKVTSQQMMKRTRMVIIPPLMRTALCKRRVADVDAVGPVVIIGDTVTEGSIEDVVATEVLTEVTVVAEDIEAENEVRVDLVAFLW